VITTDRRTVILRMMTGGASLAGMPAACASLLRIPDDRANHLYSFAVGAQRAQRVIDAGRGIERSPSIQPLVNLIAT
jgi:hypothetical protein